VIVGVTDNRVNEAKYLLYEEWLREGRPEAEIVRLTPGDGNRGELARCDGLVLTGGGDVDPALYGGDAGNRTLYEISADRDRFEAGLVEASLGAGRPILGICRGMQLVNVVFGGTLIIDLEEAGHPPHGTVNGVKCRHDVILEPASALGAALGAGRGPVSSSHHQAVGKIGKDLAIAARSVDGVVEALETARPGGGFSVLLVQWHPERMDAGGSPLSGGIRNLFFQSITTT
jgi:putative glutamine amidotransferase